MTGASRTRGLIVLCAILGTVTPLACSSDSDNPGGPNGATRTYHMGFSNFPAAPDTMSVRRTLELVLEHGDAAIMHLDVPWAELLAGNDADSLARANVRPLVNFYRASQLLVVIETDVTNGINRTAEAPALVALGRSLTEDTVQKLYESYVVALANETQPLYLGLASETNLIRLAGPPGVYDAIVNMTNAAAPKIHDVSPTSLYVSVQVEVAWGRLGGPNTYVGIDQDLADFPFISALGLSTYPYLGGFAAPSAVPDDYFARLANSAVLPVLVTEGGWSSADIGAIHSSPDLQASWIRRASELLDAARAAAWFQLDITDLNLAAFGFDPNDPQLAPFAKIGLLDTSFVPKPALLAWDSVFALPVGLASGNRVTTEMETSPCCTRHVRPRSF